MEGARCMLLDSGLGNEFWGYAVLATAHIMNRMPSRAHARKSPYETWTGTKPTVGHLRVFGCPAQVHIPAETRRKLDRKSAPFIFIGYAEDQGTRVYKLYNEQTRKVITSRDVVFDENTLARKEKGVVEEMEQERESWPTRAPMSRNISQHTSRDMLSQQTNDRNNEYSNEDTNKTPTPSPTSTNRESSVSTDDIEESITLQAPATTSSMHSRARRQPRRPANAEDTAGEEEVGLQDRPATAEGTRRPQRTRRPVDLSKPAIWKALVARTNEEPTTLADALASPDATEWKKAWDSEVESLEENGTWVLEELPLDRKAIGCRWVFKIKEDGRFKARLVAKGYSQRLGIDYLETYAPVAKFTTLRILLSLVNKNNWELDGMDVKTAFLHSELEETIYMEILEGIKSSAGDTSGLACLLIKTIYGLKQSP